MKKTSRWSQKLHGKIQGLRHRMVGTARYTTLALGGKLINMPIDSITDEFAFSFGPEGWNYYRALLEECGDPKSEVSSEKSQFWRFFEHGQIRSIRTLNWSRLRKPGHLKS